MENCNVTTITKKIVGVSLNKEKQEGGKIPTENVKATDVLLPDDAPARMITLRAENKKWYLTVVYHPETEAPFALFCHTNNKEKTTLTSDAVDRLVSLAKSKKIMPEHIDKVLASSVNESNVSKLSRAISLLLRHGVLIKNIILELDKMDDIFIGSFLFQVKKFLSQYVLDGEVVDFSKCDKCEGELVFSEGCVTCRDCGQSKCG